MTLLGVKNPAWMASLTPIPDPFAHLDFSDASSITKDGGDRISAITDQTPNNHDFSQATGANQPLLVAAEQNGLDIGRFDGGDSFLISDEASSVWKFLHDGTPFSFLIVTNVTVASPAAVYYWFGTDTGSSSQIGFRWAYNDVGASNAVQLDIGNGNSGQAIFADTGDAETWPVQTWDIGSGLHSQSGSPNDVNTFRSNTELQALTKSIHSYSSSDPQITLQIGAGPSVGAPLTGDIAEWLIWNKRLTAGQRIAIVNEKITKWGI